MSGFGEWCMEWLGIGKEGREDGMGWQTDGVEEVW